MASQIAPELEENIKDYIQKTMKEVKKEATTRLNKQSSKDDQNDLTPTQKDFYQSKPQTNENLMELEEEKLPSKPPTLSTASINNLNSNLINDSLSRTKDDISISNSSNPNKKRNSMVEFDDMRKIKGILK